MNLSNKVALVTGSTSGIGLGIARAFAGAGANVMLNGFGDKALIDKLLAEFASEYKIRRPTAPPTCPGPPRSPGWSRMRRASSAVSTSW